MALTVQVLPGPRKLAQGLYAGMTQRADSKYLRVHQETFLYETWPRHR